MSESDDCPPEERAYLLGSTMAWRIMLGHCIRELLGNGEDDLKAERLLAERTDAIMKLRDICERYGDNDWDDDLHLADIIDKHLHRHLLEPE